MRDVTTRARWAAGLNLVFPGSGYVYLKRRVVLGGLLMAYALATSALGILHVVTMVDHWHHLDPWGHVGVGTQVALYTVQHGFLVLGLAWDGWREAHASEP